MQVEDRLRPIFFLSDCPRKNFVFRSLPFWWLMYVKTVINTTSAFELWVWFGSLSNPADGESVHLTSGSCEHRIVLLAFAVTSCWLKQLTALSVMTQFLILLLRLGLRLFLLILFAPLAVHFTHFFLLWNVILQKNVVPVFTFEDLLNQKV